MSDNRIGPNRGPSHRSHAPGNGGNLPPEQLADQRNSFRMQRDTLAVEIDGGACSRGEDEIPLQDAVLLDEHFQSFAAVHAGATIDDASGGHNLRPVLYFFKI